jgi:hypothetical protein
MMECQDIRKNLSAYREGMVSPENQELIEQHLASCRSCSAALHELNRVGELVKKLEEVEPPPWMKQKIMARVREEAEQRKGFLRKIFYPLHIKVPLEAFATVLIAVVAVYVFKAVEPQMKDLQAPSPREPVIARQEAPYPAKAPAAEKPVQAEKALSQAESERAKVKGLEQAEREAKLGEKKVTQEPSPSPKETQAPPAPPQVYAPAPPKQEVTAAKTAETPAVAESRRMQEPSQPPPATVSRPRQEESLSAAGSAVRDAQELKKARPMAPSLGAVAKEKADVMRVKIQAKDIHAAGAKTIGLLNQLGARTIARESRETAEIITAEVKAEKVKELIERLRSVGEAEEKDARLDTLAMDTTLRIEIVPLR